MSVFRARRFDTVTNWLAFTIVGAVAAVAAVTVSVFIASRPTPMPVVSARWLAAAIGDVIAAYEAGQYSEDTTDGQLQRLFTIERRAEPVLEGPPGPGPGPDPGPGPGFWLGPRPGPGPEPGPPPGPGQGWGPGPGPPPGPPGHLVERFLQQLLADNLRQRGLPVSVAASVRVQPLRFRERAGLPPRPPGPLLRFSGDLPPPAADLSARLATSADLAVPTAMTIGVQLHDGSWLVIEGIKSTFSRWERTIWMCSLILCGVLVAGFAWWASRRLLRPLRELSMSVDALARQAPLDVRERGPVELRQIARSFNNMQRRLLGFVEERLRMTAAISHDLRTPITRLRLRTEYIDDAELKRKVTDDLDAMEGIVNDTLCFAEIAVSDEKPEPVDLDTLLQDVCGGLAEFGKPIAYAGEPTVMVQAPPLALERALVNLVGNALKYGQHVCVALMRDDTWADITITDDGPGIDNADKERVFDAFFRTDRSRNSETGGTGLGLTIAKTVIEKCNGTLRLLDNRPHGLVVRARLPLA